MLRWLIILPQRKTMQRYYIGQDGCRFLVAFMPFTVRLRLQRYDDFGLGVGSGEYQNTNGHN